MDVFDSSVWLWGLITDEPQPNRLLDEVLDGTRTVAISAYIHDEVTTALSRSSESSQKIADAQMTFNNTIADLDNVVFPDQAAIGQTHAAEIRAQPAMGVIGTVLEIQRKDAPVLVFAVDISDDTTLYVADEGFTIEPADHNLDTLEIQHIDVPE